MIRAKIPLVSLHELAPGQYADFFALLVERTKGATRDGKPYYACRFRDARRTVSCMVWADSSWFETCERDWQEGHFYKLRAVYNEHERYGPQIEIQNIRPAMDADRADGFDPAQIVESTRFSVDDLFKQLVELAGNELQDAPLRRLVFAVLEKYEQPLKELPASENRFYPFRGGWLEHVLSVTQNCLRLADHYRAHYPNLQPPLNRDLVVAGAVLHDIGRVLELQTESASPQPTVPGKLFGHLLLGRDVIRDAARALGDVNPELVQLLEHIVLTHLTLPEWGSPRLPLIPEVLILHHADDLDAKMEMYARCLSRDQSAGPFTARDPVLGKPLLKQRTV
jgi:3'-5' exoribonuclease